VRYLRKYNSLPVRLNTVQLFISFNYLFISHVVLLVSCVADQWVGAMGKSGAPTMENLEGQQGGPFSRQ
jgi:hypothetical protein